MVPASVGVDVGLQLAELARGVVHGTVTPSQPAGVGVIARPALAPANWSFSSALIRYSVFAGVMPSCCSRSKNFSNAAS